MSRADLGARFRGFVAELRRRKVFRAAIAYAIVGVGVAEGAALFLPALGAPDWLPNVIAVIVVLGFPVAMGLAWVFDIVPDNDDESADAAEGTSVEAPRSAAQMEGQHLSHYDIM